MSEDVDGGFALRVEAGVVGDNADVLLATAAGAHKGDADPLDFRLKYLKDPRGIELLQRLAALSKWGNGRRRKRTLAPVMLALGFTLAATVSRLSRMNVSNSKSGWKPICRARCASRFSKNRTAQLSLMK